MRKFSFYSLFVAVFALGLAGCSQNGAVTPDESSASFQVAGKPAAKQAVGPTADRLMVMVSVMQDGSPQEGVEVALGQSAAGKATTYAWSGTTDANGKAVIEVSGMKISGYFAARATSSAGAQVGWWHSIPLNGGSIVDLHLNVGGRATIANSTNLPVSDLGFAKAYELQQMLDRLVSQLNVPGATVAVKIFGQGTWVGASGVADVASRKPMTVDTRFKVGSLTKTVVASTVLQMVRDGDLSLGDTVEQHLPGAINNGENITIKMLLDHTSGLFNFILVEQIQGGFLFDPTHVYTNQDLLDIANANEPYFAPGTEGAWRYSNTNYILLGQIIEKIAGTDLESVFQNRIYGPMGLKNTVFITQNNIPGYSASGYAENPFDNCRVIERTFIDPSVTWASGSLVSTAEDMMIWNEELMTGTLIGSALQAQRLMGPTAQLGAVAGTYGLGIADIEGWVGHAGQFPAYDAISHGKEGMGIVTVLTNKQVNCVGNMYDPTAAIEQPANTIFKEFAETLFNVRPNVMSVPPEDVLIAQ